MSVALRVTCPRCDQPEGKDCVTRAGRRPETEIHSSRWHAYRAEYLRRASVHVVRETGEEVVTIPYWPDPNRVAVLRDGRPDGVLGAHDVRWLRWA